MTSELLNKLGMFLKLLNIVSEGKKRVSHIFKRYKWQVLLGICLLTIFVGVVGAIVYSSMLMQGNISVEACCFFE
jgi:hypothetical protein